MLSSIMVALGDLERSTYYVCRAMKNLEMIVEARAEVRQPMNRVLQILGFYRLTGGPVKTAFSKS